MYNNKTNIMKVDKQEVVNRLLDGIIVGGIFTMLYCVLWVGSVVFGV